MERLKGVLYMEDRFIIFIEIPETFKSPLKVSDP